MFGLYSSSNTFEFIFENLTFKFNWSALIAIRSFIRNEKDLTDDHLHVKGSDQSSAIEFDLINNILIIYHHLYQNIQIKRRSFLKISKIYHENIFEMNIHVYY